jgi:hypothetical protein
MLRTSFKPAVESLEDRLALSRTFEFYAPLPHFIVPPMRPPVYYQPAPAPAINYTPPGYVYTPPTPTPLGTADLSGNVTLTAVSPLLPGYYTASASGTSAFLGDWTATGRILLRNGQVSGQVTLTAAAGTISGTVSGPQRADGSAVLSVKVTGGTGAYVNTNNSTGTLTLTPNANGTYSLKGSVNLAAYPPGTVFAA